MGIENLGDYGKGSILPRPPGKKYRAPENYDPLGTLPPGGRSKYLPMLKRASEGSLPAMVRLKCLECCAWSPAEVARCEINQCPLYARNRREEVQPDGA